MAPEPRSARWWPGTADVKKHRIYKYSGFWYGCCGASSCAEVVCTRQWRSTLDRLEFHLQEHRSLTMAETVSQT